MAAPKPCTHCNGSGSEPDPIEDARMALAGAIATARTALEFEGRESAGDAVAAAADRFARLCDLRIAAMEDALSGLLACCTPPGWPAAPHTIAQIPNADLESCRAVLAGMPARNPT